ncbi:phosphoenolpyruvate synthase [Candidatus Dependentiae bacterium]|nr:phosphoenolpyruvate synthase [Candidatus Dependentiae bacterium]
MATMTKPTQQSLLFFDNPAATDVALVGGKASSLALLYQQMHSLGIQVPYGFAAIADTYYSFINHNNLQPTIDAAMQQYKQNPTVEQLQIISSAIRTAIEQGEFPEAVAHNFITEYQHLHRQTCHHCYPQQPRAEQQQLRQLQVPIETTWRHPIYPLDTLSTTGCSWSVAVRSSATAEDSPTASFAGQQETMLNVAGTTALLQAIKRCLSSLYTPRAIIYRIEQGFDYRRIALSVIIQQMVRADLGAAGVIFTLDPESGFQDVITITGSYGLGELVVQGEVTPDSWYLQKSRLAAGYPAICTSIVGIKKVRLGWQGVNQTERQAVNDTAQHLFCLTPEQVISLGQQAIAIEQLYSSKQGSWCPMDIEWALDGLTQQLFIVQARPETVHSKRDRTTITLTAIAAPDQSKLQPIAQGISIGQGAVSGTIQKITSAQDIAHFVPGNILVTRMTDPDWVPVMKQARAIITAQGGRTCHAAIVSRELGIPALVGIAGIFELLHDGQSVTLDCTTGMTGYLYDGILATTTTHCKLNTLPPSPIPYYMNIGQPERAFTLAQYPVAGIGLARTEFIIANRIAIHPMAAIHPEKITDNAVIAHIAEKTAAYATATDYFVQTLAQQIATIAAAFWPRPVIVRSSDFKSNEYYNLIGGSFFEPAEENPMLGLRGASRYLHPRYQAAFSVECRAFAMARNNLGFTNIALMIPFVRTLQELDAVLQRLQEHGLVRGQQELKIYTMCELPANIMQLLSMQERVDGVSIGSNDLTQLMLGVDRDCADVAALYNEQDPAVMQIMKTAINNAHAAHLTIGICGQGPSDFPALAQTLIENDIDYLSLNPDAVITLLQRQLHR